MNILYTSFLQRIIIMLCGIRVHYFTAIYMQLGGAISNIAVSNRWSKGGES